MLVFETNIYFFWDSENPQLIIEWGIYLDAASMQVNKILFIDLLLSLLYLKIPEIVICSTNICTQINIPTSNHQFVHKPGTSWWWRKPVTAIDHCNNLHIVWIHIITQFSLCNICIPKLFKYLTMMHIVWFSLACLRVYSVLVLLFIAENSTVNNVKGISCKPVFHYTYCMTVSMKQ